MNKNKSKLPYMQFYTKDYLSNTRRLSCLEHGLYCQLLFLMWENRGVLNYNEEELAHETGLTLTEFKTAWINVKKYFEIKKGKLYNQGISDDLKEKKLISFEREKAAKTRWSKNNNKNNDLLYANALQSDANKETETETEIIKKINKKSKVTLKSLNLETIPKEWLDFALNQGLTIFQAENQFKLFCDFWISEGEAKADWLATFRNRIRNWIEQGKIKINQQSIQEQKIQSEEELKEEIRIFISRVDNKRVTWGSEQVKKYKMTEKTARELINNT